jgi:hypothetical protein
MKDETYKHASSGALHYLAKYAVASGVYIYHGKYPSPPTLHCGEK